MRHYEIAATVDGKVIDEASVDDEDDALKLGVINIRVDRGVLAAYLLRGLDVRVEIRGSEVVAGKERTE